MKIFHKQVDEEKCDGCGWRTNHLFVLANSKKEAEKLFKEGFGLCSACMVESLLGLDIEIK